MRAKKKINQSHPRYADYIAECKALFFEYDAWIEAERAKYPDWNGLDHPSYTVVRPLDRERNAKLRKIQEKYGFLFSEEDEG